MASMAYENQAWFSYAADLPGTAWDNTAYVMLMMFYSAHIEVFDFKFLGFSSIFSIFLLAFF